MVKKCFFPSSPLTVGVIIKTFYTAAVNASVGYRTLKKILSIFILSSFAFIANALPTYDIRTASPIGTIQNNIDYIYLLATVLAY